MAKDYYEILGVDRKASQDDVKKAFRKPVHGVIGGFHLKARTVEEIGLEAARLKAAGVDMVAPLHCTGVRAEEVFRQVFGSGCRSLREGQEITL